MKKWTILIVAFLLITSVTCVAFAVGPDFPDEPFTSMQNHR
jgi:hypothetical protein